MDFPNELLIEVKREDIEGAGRQACFNCPITRAVKRTLGLAGEKSVGTVPQGVLIFTLDVSDGALCITNYYPFPANIIEQVDEYDNGGEFLMKEIVLTKYKRN